MNTEDKFFDLSTPEGRTKALERTGAYHEYEAVRNQYEGLRRNFFTPELMRDMVRYIAVEIEKHIEEEVKPHDWSKEGF